MVNSQGRQLVLESKGLADLDDVANQIRQHAGSHRVWLLSVIVLAPTSKLTLVGTVQSKRFSVVMTVITTSKQICWELSLRHDK